MATPDNASRSVILLVDDNIEVLQATSDLLKIWKFPVLTARNGREALNIMGTHADICLVVLDLWMPVMDGWEFLRRKKSDPAIADIPVIVLSAIPPESLDGAEIVLTKPVDPGRLEAIIRQYYQQQ
jgi:CheY-like chemotaxis protein